MNNDPRYDPVSATLPASLPAISREEAERAARLIVRTFGKRSDGGPNMAFNMKAPRAARRCWISTKETVGPSKGWGRLVHDLSHMIFRRRHPSFRPHDGGHATLEREIAEFVMSKGFLSGTLRPAVKKPSTTEKRQARLARTEAGIERWQAKLKRAENAIRKLKRRQAALRRSLA